MDHWKRFDDQNGTLQLSAHLLYLVLMRFDLLAFVLAGLFVVEAAAGAGDARVACEVFTESESAAAVLTGA